MKTNDAVKPRSVGGLKGGGGAHFAKINDQKEGELLFIVCFHLDTRLPCRYNHSTSLSVRLPCPLGHVLFFVF